MRILLIAALAMLPHVAHAVGDNDGGGGGGNGGGSNDGGGNNDGGNNGGGSAKDDKDDVNPPMATKTTLECLEGEIWDEKTEVCVEVQGNLLDNDQRYRALRELAYAGRPAEAMAVLDTMTEGQTARVMTYRGFLLRKTGEIEAGIAAYEEAIRIDPANILARSYYGQLLVEMNELKLASLQLDAIRQHGGNGTWAESALYIAIATGKTYNF
jgi:tetratricopeptide (TPR) repeat protein